MHSQGPPKRVDFCALALAGFSEAFLAFVDHGDERVGLESDHLLPRSFRACLQLLSGISSWLPARRKGNG